MDIHDCAMVPAHKPVQPGVVLTIEPGIYIPDEERYGRYRGTGIRIEDMVLVTEDGHEVLSSGLPLSADEVEGCV